MMQSNRFSRRRFLGTTAAGAATAFAAPALVQSKSPNEKLNCAVIGVAGRGGAQLAAVGGENVVGLCDVDDSRLGAAAGWLWHRPASKWQRRVHRSCAAHL